MSELEAIELGDAYKLYDDDKEFYLKSEADKVIAEKDAEIAELKDKVREQTSIAEEGWKESGIYHTSYAEAVKELYDKNKEIAELKKERRWRKFIEEKPEKDAWCLVYHEGEIDADHYTDECNNHCRFVMYGNLVTHWMPMPSAPKENK